MLDLSHIPTMYPNADVQVFVNGAIPGAGLDSEPHVWTKPRGKTMCQLLLVGQGGNGSNGFVDTPSTAAGGGGGGSGGQAVFRFPLMAIPDCLYISKVSSFVTLDPWPLTSASLFAAVGDGSAATDAAPGVVGVGGAGGGGATPGAAGNCWLVSSLAGQSGSFGGGPDSPGATLNRPTTGLMVTGGTGGGGILTAADSQTQGGRINGAGVFPAFTPEAASVDPAAKVPNGYSGFTPVLGVLFAYGGLGGHGQHRSATGAGLVQASGGDGAPGCGGGGSGGALTGSTPGVPGKGGPAFAIFTCW